MLKHVTTRFVTIKIIKIKGTLCTLINCDCFYCTRIFYRCRHTYCVKDGKPEPNRFHLECFKTFETKNFRNNPQTNIVNKALDIIKEQKGHLTANHIKGK